MTESEGASPNECMLAACRGDQEDVLQEILEEQEFDPNFTDGIGNTAAHIAAQHGALGCLELLVNLDDINLDIQNRIDKQTPLHLAVQFQKHDVGYAVSMVDLLLEGGADPRIEDSSGRTPLQLVNPKNTELKKLLECGVVSYTMDDDDIANVDDDDDVDAGDYDSDDQASD